MFEWIVRFGAFKRKLNSLKDGWFKFDSVLVLLMVLETLILPFLLPVVSQGSSPPPTGFLRLLRLLRLSRLIRLLRSIPELVTIVKGMRAAIRAVASTFVMIIVLIYVFGILMMLLMKDDDKTHKHFSTLGLCMWTLLIEGIMWDGTGLLLNKIVHRNEFHTITAVIVFFIFTLLSSVTVLNLLSGVMVDVVSVVSQAEKEESATNLMKEKILKELKKFDDGDGLITEEELNEVMIDPRSVAVLERIGVDVTFLQTLQVMTYEDPEATVPIHEILDQMLTCRRQMPATMKHLITQQHLTIWMMSNKILAHEKRMDMKLDIRFERLLEETRNGNQNPMQMMSNEMLQREKSMDVKLDNRFDELVEETLRHHHDLHLKLDNRFEKLLQSTLNLVEETHSLTSVPTSRSNGRPQTAPSMNVLSQPVNVTDQASWL